MAFLKEVMFKACIPYFLHFILHFPKEIPYNIMQNTLYFT